MGANFSPIFGSYKYTGSFRFWVQKVLPLVYDDSLSYYELLCKVVNYLNDVIANVDTLNENVNALKEAYDKLQEYVNNYFDTVDWDEKLDRYFKTFFANEVVNESYYNLFAQVLPTNERTFGSGFSQQGFCIGEYNNRPVVCNCFADGTSEGTSNIIKFTYMDTGVEIGSYVIPSGHCNSATFNPISGNYLIACGGGNSTNTKLLEINIQGRLLKQHELEFGCWGVTFNDTLIYCLSGSYMIILNQDFEEQTRYLMDLNHNLTYQGIFSDDLYIYLPCGNTVYYADDANINLIGVYLHDGTLMKYITNTIPFEVEECDIYNNICYACASYQDMGQILTMDLYSDNKSGTLGGTHVITDVDKWQYMYIDETYTGFFQNGSEEYPLSTLLRYTAFIKSNTTRVVLGLLSDCKTHSFTEYLQLPYEVMINGNNHYIRNINYRANSTLILNNLGVVGVNNNVAIFVESPRFVISNVYIGENGSVIRPSRLLEVHGFMEITGLTLNCNVTSDGTSLYIMGDGYIRTTTTNATFLRVFFMAGTIDVDGTFASVYRLCNDVSGTNNQISLYINTDISTNELRASALIECATNVSVTGDGVPEGFNTNLYCIIVERINTNHSFVTFVKRDGTYASAIITNGGTPTA